VEQVDAHDGLVAEPLVEVEAAQLEGEGLLQAKDAGQVAQQVGGLDELHPAALPVDVGAAGPYEDARQDRHDRQQDVRGVHHLEFAVRVQLRRLVYRVGICGYCLYFPDLKAVS